jgi:hypothetical protein
MENGPCKALAPATSSMSFLWSAFGMILRVDIGIATQEAGRE